MTDEDLARGLNIPVGHVMVLSPDKRARYERMLEIAERLTRGEHVPGVLVDPPRPRKRYVKFDPKAWRLNR